MKHDPVNNPTHYLAGGITPTMYAEAKGWSKGFCLGNVIKYVTRAGEKPGSDELEDLKKACWYLKRYINYLESNEVGSSNQSWPEDLKRIAESGTD